MQNTSEICGKSGHKIFKVYTHFSLLTVFSYKLRAGKHVDKSLVDFN